MPPATTEPGRKWSGLQTKRRGAPDRTRGRVRAKDERQELDPVARMAVMLKDLQQEVRLLKEGKTQEVRDNVPPVGNQDRT